MLWLETSKHLRTGWDFDTSTSEISMDVKVGKREDVFAWDKKLKKIGMMAARLNVNSEPTLKSMNPLVEAA
ncbi:hypothetical protein Q7C36_023270 [Tachysurus vachellii]|uniref:Uncharacterized protein n=1 Tax=Tachysurus vachellii TaxID=175792 RepID=A0AA88IKX4_TACVA|nr:hypothetical protein Q7C36_023270 [Tachysurus vachellii]